FTLYLPATYTSRQRKMQGAAEVHERQEIRLPSAPAASTSEAALLAAMPETGQLVNEVGDDRGLIQVGDRVLLIVENDLGFARFMLDTGREKGFKGIVTSLGA